jgi:DNA-binding MarR family transcriptional regulator
MNHHDIRLVSDSTAPQEPAFDAVSITAGDLEAQDSKWRELDVPRAECRRMVQWMRGWRQLGESHGAALLHAEVTQREYTALLEIQCSDQKGGPNIGMLAAALQVRHNSAVGLVTALCGKGYVERHRYSDDRRQTHVRLTERGRAVLGELLRAQLREFQKIRAGLLLDR